jgi:2-polyprenyl-3-methyl-5-hydroxy-6-metoxy-1,4-benzoquinol methylase
MADSATYDRDELAGRLFGATLGAMDLLAIYLGDRLGFYRALAEHGSTTSAELAETAAADERYVREWLEQQAVTGILAVDDGGCDGAARRFRLPPGHAEVLTDPDNLATMIPVARFLAGIAGVLPALLEAYRTGDGVPYPRYGADGREGQAGMTRPLFNHLLGSEWLPALPDVHARLSADPPAAVADVGCGAGWSSIAIARAYPKARVDGFDLDNASIELARRHAVQAGVGDRVQFQVRDAGDPALAGRYDLVCAFECIHDMSNPVAALRAMRQLAGEGGVVLIADEKVADRFTAPGDEIERFMYGFSILHCLPVGRAEQPSAATGTVMRQDILRRYADDAGFRAVETLPIAHDWWRFYRLVA